jgi:hypothetical protein
LRVPVPQFGLEDLGAYVVQVRAAVFFPPAWPQPALGAQSEVKTLIEGRGPLAHPRVYLGGQVLIQERPDLLGEGLLTSGEDSG